MKRNCKTIITFLITILIIMMFAGSVFASTYEDYKDTSRSDFEHMTVDKLSDISANLQSEKNSLDYNTKDTLGKEISSLTDTVNSVTYNKLANYNKTEIETFVKNNNQIPPLSDNDVNSLKNKWKETTNHSIDDQIDKLSVRSVSSSSAVQSPIYKKAEKDANTQKKSGIDDMFDDAEAFLNKKDESGTEVVYEASDLQDLSQTIYSIVLAIGIVFAVIYGAIIGIKIMTAGVEEKADYKQHLIPYAVGCAVMFGAFGIWKIVLTILQNV